MPDPSDSRRSANQRPEPDWLSLDLVETAGDWSAFGSVADAVDAAGAALARHARFRDEAPAEACVALSDDANVRALNARFRHKDKATNVLSFPAPAAPDGTDAGRESLGDVVLAAETVAREAAELSISPVHHLQHLVVHGLLHLLGYDHEQEEEAREMEALEIEILASLGIADPYAHEERQLAAAQSR